MHCQISLSQNVTLLMHLKSSDQAGLDLMEKKTVQKNWLHKARICVIAKAGVCLFKIKRGNLTGFVIFIYGFAFFITFSSKIKLVTTESLPYHTVES